MWRALRDAMRVRRTPRIGSAEVERLIAGDPTGPDHDGLAALLAAASAPASPDELAGERAAVARLSAAYRDAGRPVRPRRSTRRTRILSSVRALTVKVTAAAAVLAVGGTAVAAQTGNLPPAAQDRAHRIFSALGVPAPETAAPPVIPAPSGPGRTRPPAATPTPRPGAVASADPAVAGLCRAWQAARENPRGKALPATSRRALAAAAGGQSNVPAFCAARLAGPAPTPDPGTPGRSGPPDSPGGTGKPSSSPTGSGNESGKPGKTGKPDRPAEPGNGNGNDHGNGNDRRTGDSPKEPGRPAT
jgi:hypothetical protein